MQVAIQGIRGSFHEQAAALLLKGQPFEPLPCESFQDVFKAVKNGDAEFGVIAVENSLHGSINAVYRLLMQKQLWVMGEVYLQIEQYLITAKPIEPEDFALIDAVLSQAPALAQCETWLDEHLPQANIEEMHDTAESVRYVVRYPEKTLAAIAGKQAAELYGGTIIAGPINDDKHNYTRFFLMSPGEVKIDGTDKTSIILETSHEPGALYRALGVFADAGVNLSKLDSHPIAGDKWHYAFYLDFDAGSDNPSTAGILKALKAQGCSVHILGSYRAGTLPI